MKIGLVSRLDSQRALDLAEKILNYHFEGEFILAPSIAKETGGEGKPIEDMNVDSIVTIGGDGTVLYTIQKSLSVPVLGINMGGRGFLADVNPEDALKAIEKLIKNELELVERERLSVEISGKKLADALNEGVIRSKEPSRVLSFRVLIDEEEAEKTRGDGLIVATPTGSTAYAMAAGGPVIDPKLKASVIVPLSTYRPRAMPLVCSIDSKIVVELSEPGKKADLTVDGQVTEELAHDEEIKFRKSKENAKFFKWKKNFYEKMREKL